MDMAGNGFGFWNTMPTCRRTCTAGVPFPYTSMSPMRTLPLTRVSGRVSCMRLMQRTKVDLPQPEGPMMAVAWLGAMRMAMSCSAWVAPNQAFRLSTSMPTPMLGGSFHHAPAGDKAHHGDGSDNEQNQHQRPGPRLPVPFVVGRNSVDKNLQREGGDGLVDIGAPELAAKGGEQQWRGLAGHAGEGQHYAGDDSGRCRAQGNGNRGAPAGNSQAQRRLAHRARHQQQHFL